MRSQTRPRQQKEKLNQPKEQKMNLKKQMAVIVLALTATTSLVWSADRQASRAVTPTLVGVWQVVRQAVDCDDPNQQLGPSFPALMTFHSDGTVHGDLVGPGGTAAEGTAEHGVWQREPGRQNYSLREVSYGWDPDTGAFEGSAVFTETLHLTSANSFEGSATIQIFDADGNLVVTVCARRTGTRFE
jgi:hypothetical protein